MTVTITPEMEALVNERISRGQYATPEGVVIAGLRLLREVDARKESELRHYSTRRMKTFAPVW